MPLMQVTANTASVHSVEGCTCHKRQRTIGTSCSQPPLPHLSGSHVPEREQTYRSRTPLPKIFPIGIAGFLEAQHAHGDLWAGD